MTRIGILRLNDTPQFRDKIACIIGASMGVDIFFFRPRDVDFENRTIRGLFFDEDAWHQSMYEFPDVIYNHLPLSDADKELFNLLATEIPFTTHRIGNKNVVLRQLAQEGTFQDVLIPMHRVKKGKTIFPLIEKYGKVVFKPANGKQGQRIYTIEPEGEQYRFSHLLESTVCSTGELITRIEEETKRNPMIVQPFIASQTIHGHSYCMRIHVAMGANGQWKLVKYFPFVSNNHQESVSHLSHGAFSTTRMDIFMKQNYPDQHEAISRRIVDFARRFPVYFESFYDYPLDALGIDIGISADGKIYLYEVNSLPGTRYVEFQAEYLAVQYCQYLATHGRPGVHGLDRGWMKERIEA